MTVVLNLPPSPGFQRKTVKGRAHVPQERPYSCFDYGDELGKALKDENCEVHHTNERVRAEAWICISSMSKENKTIAYMFHRE